MELKDRHSIKRYEGTFVGLHTNGDTCVGNIVVIEKKRLEKSTKK